MNFANFKLKQDNRIGCHEADANKHGVEVQPKAVQRLHGGLDRQLTLETLQLKFLEFLERTEVGSLIEENS